MGVIQTAIANRRFKRKPDKFFGTVIDAAENNMDLHPSTRAVLKAIEGPAYYANKNGEPKRPVVVLMGRQKFSPIQSMFQHHVLTRLPEVKVLDHHKPPYSFAYGHLGNYNQLDQELPDCVRMGRERMTPEIKAEIRRQDIDGQKTLMEYVSSFSYCRSDEGEEAKQILLQSCLKNQTSTRFNDLSHDRNGHLVRTDARAVEYWGKYGDNPYLARNHAIVDSAMAHIADTRAQIYVQDCRPEQMFGQRDKRAHAQSLSVLFAEAGASVVTVLVTNEAFPINDIPFEVRDGLINTVLVRNLAERQFFRGQSRSSCSSQEAAVISARVRERMFIEKICVQSAINKAMTEDLDLGRERHRHLKMNLGAYDLYPKWVAQLKPKLVA